MLWKNKMWILFSGCNLSKKLAARMTPAELPASRWWRRCASHLKLSKQLLLFFVKSCKLRTLFRGTRAKACSHILFPETDSLIALKSSADGVIVSRFELLCFQGESPATFAINVDRRLSHPLHTVVRSGRVLQIQKDSVENPGEGEIHGGVVRGVALQRHVLALVHVGVGGSERDLGGICVILTQRYEICTQHRGQCRPDYRRVFEKKKCP